MIYDAINNIAMSGCFMHCTFSNKYIERNELKSDRKDLVEANNTEESIDIVQATGRPVVGNILASKNLFMVKDPDNCKIPKLLGKNLPFKDTLNPNIIKKKKTTCKSESEITNIRLMLFELAKPQH